jgi:hypothetical protein
MVTDNDQEIALVNILKKFDLDLSLRYIGRTQQTLQKLALHRSKPRAIEYDGTKIAFRLTTAPPVYVMLSHPICRFSSLRPYAINIDIERSFLSEMALVPVYFASFNQMTVLKTHEGRARLFFDEEKNLSLPMDGVVCWELTPSRKPAELSSMNFILLFESGIKRAPQWIEELMKRYFLQFFWEPRGFDMSGSTHFLHVRTDYLNKITGIINVVKTFFVVEEIYGHRTITVANKEVNCADVRLRGVFKSKTSGYEMREVDHAFIDSKLAAEYGLENILQTGFINGIVTEIIQKDHTGQPERLKLFQVIVDYGTTYQGLAESLIGFASMDNFKNWDTTSAVGTAESLRIQVSQLLALLIRETRLYNTLGTLLQDASLGKMFGLNWFDRALKEVDPIVFEWRQRIHYVHPLIWSLLASRNITTNESYLKPVVKNLLELLFKVQKHRVKDFYALAEYKSLKQLGFDFSLDEVQKLADDLSLSRITNGYVNT